MEHTIATEAERVSRLTTLRTSNNLQPQLPSPGQRPRTEDTIGEPTSWPTTELPLASQATDEAQILEPGNDNMDHPDRLRQDLIALGIADFRGLPLQQLIDLVRRRIPDVISESRRLGIFYAWLNDRLGMIDVSDDEAFRNEIHAWCTTLGKCGFEPKEILREYHAWKSEHALMEPSSSRRLDLANVELTTMLGPHIRGPITPILPACRLTYKDPPAPRRNAATGEHGNMHPDRLMRTRDIIDVEEWERPVVEISSDDEDDDAEDLSFLTGANALVRMGNRFNLTERKRATKVIDDLETPRGAPVTGKQSHKLNRAHTAAQKVSEKPILSNRMAGIPAHHGYPEKLSERSTPHKRSAAIRTPNNFAEKVSERSIPGKPLAVIPTPADFPEKVSEKPAPDKRPEAISTPSKAISTPSNYAEKDSGKSVPGKRLVGFPPLGAKPPDGYICKRCTRSGWYPSISTPVAPWLTSVQ